MSKRYIVRRISTRSLAVVRGLADLVMVLPGLLLAAVGIQVVAGLRFLLDRGQTAEVDPLGLGAPVGFDIIQLFGLEAVQALLVQLDDQRWLLALLIVLVCAVGGGILVALSVLLVGWGYNLLAALSGGLEIELRE